jgi:SAM-dependent methyltransferase
MTAESEATRQQLWDERHGARDPIERREPDPDLVAVVGALPPGRAVDLACGDGRHAVWLASRGWTVTGVDFSRVGLERAREAAEAAGLTVAWEHEDLLAWEPAAGMAELVVVAFLHLPPEDRRAVFAKAATALVPGGRLLILGHDRVNLGRDVPGPRDPAYLYTPEDAASDLPGLVIDEARRADHDLGDGRVSTNTVVVAHRPAG